MLCWKSTRGMGSNHRALIPVIAGMLLIIGGLCGASQAATRPVDYTQFSLEDLMEMNVVYGASKHMQTSKEAPSSITIVSREEIQTYGYRTMAEVLTSLRGFNLTYDRNYQYIGVRGLGNPGDLSARILVLVDGIRVNEGSIGGVLLGHGFPVDIDLIERIEVIRGPASSLYGTNAMLGIVNVVTREGYQINGVEVQVGASSYGGLSARLTGGYETESGLDLLISGRLGEVAGQDHYIEEFDYPDWNNGVFEDGDREAWHSLFGKATYGGLTLEALYAWRSKQNPMAPVGVIFNSNEAMTEDQQTTFSARYKTKLADKIDLSSQVYYQHFAYDGQWPYDFDYEGNPLDYVDLYIDKFRGKRLTADLDLSGRFLGDHVLAIGAEYQNNFQMDMSAIDDNPYYEWYSFEQSPTNWGVYALTELHVVKGLLLNLGVRHDEYTSFGGSTNPRLALVGEPIEDTVFKALYGTAFRAPNAYEISAGEFEGTNANLTLIPEEIETFELIWEQGLGKNLFSTVAAYHYDYKEITDEEGVEEDVPPEEWINDAIESVGFEVELERRSRSGVAGRCSYSFNEATDRLQNPRWSDPKGSKHMAKLNVAIPVRNDATRFGVELQYNSKRRTIMHEWAPEHLLTNISLTNTSLLSNLRIQGSVYNLFNKSHGHPGTWGEYQEIIWQDGRSYRLFLTFTN